MKSSLRRSALYMPASNSRTLEKARTLPADLLIFDLEDSIAPDMKVQARMTVSPAIREGGYGEREVVLRMNGMGTDFWDDDLRVLEQCQPDAVLIPKINTPMDVVHTMSALSLYANVKETGLWLMIETPAAILNASQIAARAEQYPQLQGFVIGTNDLAKDTGILPGEKRAHFLPWLMTVVAAAKANGLAVLDGVFNDFTNETGFADEVAQGRALGMTGKTLIHPRQIVPCNLAFSPSEAEILEAKKIVAAFRQQDAAKKGVIAVDGKMVERLHLEMAEALLRRARGI